MRVAGDTCSTIRLIPVGSHAGGARDDVHGTVTHGHVEGSAPVQTVQRAPETRRTPKPEGRTGRRADRRCTDDGPVVRPEVGVGTCAVRPVHRLSHHHFWDEG